MTDSSFLVVETSEGTVSFGVDGSFRGNAPFSGELVFQTGMTGFVETLTDPSYTGQVVVFTAPVVGAYAADLAAMSESTSASSGGNPILVAGVVVADAQPGLVDMLTGLDVPFVTGVDTRALTLAIRESTTPCLAAFNTPMAPPPSTLDMLSRAVSADVVVHAPPNPSPSAQPLRVVALDFGMKAAQLRCLQALHGGNVEVTVLPWSTPLPDLSDVDGLFVSNGPGDPGDVPRDVIEGLARAVRHAADTRTAVFGICFGHQLLARAWGFRTYRMSYGNRGQNVPVRCAVPGLTHVGAITSQNHGYAVDVDAAPPGSDMVPFFTNTNDGSNEGLVSQTLPVMSVQFHPEAAAGPLDTRWLFDVFGSLMTSDAPTSATHAVTAILQTARPPTVAAAPITPITKVLVLGSGGLTIGQAGEFDYSGSQAIMTYKSLGLEVVLVNSNAATVQTTIGVNLADRVYSLPLTPAHVRRVIDTERPDAIALAFGGQTALNCGVALQRSGALDGVRVLGTPVSCIQVTEDRAAFADVVRSVGFSVAPSRTVTSLDAALAAAAAVGYPVLVRASFALGGQGSGFAADTAELTSAVAPLLHQGLEVTVDKSLKGWKEVEYEVVRDAAGNTVVVCTMENVDPVGVHTGESVVVAPALTLDNTTYFELRRCCQAIADAVGIVGEGNVQFAVDPQNPASFFVIEMNARLSRSSALASKATGYPLAAVAARLGMPGTTLFDIPNALTQSMTALLEPALDFVVVKMPRWDLAKFAGVSDTLGTAMKSVGEVMAIGRTFREAFAKALDMVGVPLASMFQDRPLADLSVPTPRRMADVLHWLAMVPDSAAAVCADTAITFWFVGELARLVETATTLHTHVVVDELDDVGAAALRDAKASGFTTADVAALCKSTPSIVRAALERLHIVPFLRRIDSVANEFPAPTNYMYVTYNAEESDAVFVDPENPKTLALGSGPYCIGSSVEFDWCAVSAARELRARHHVAVMLNCNPETVSTDFDQADVLVFDNVSEDNVLALHHVLHLDHVVVSVGGQASNTLAQCLDRHGLALLGTSADSIDRSENRFKFSRLCDTLGIAQPAWKRVTDADAALAFAASVGYPVLVRPSFVLSGAAMNVAFTPDDLAAFVERAQALPRSASHAVSGDPPVVVSQFILDGKEVDVDAVALHGAVVVDNLSEHVENAGVHSGDATLVSPPFDLTAATVGAIQAATTQLAKELAIHGPFNIQFIAKDDRVYVIECNLRASRSMPFVSKVTGVNYVQLAVQGWLREAALPPLSPRSVVPRDRVAVKSPTFSFHRLPGADCVLGVDMMSTGEVVCFGKTVEVAFLKALAARGFRLPALGPRTPKPKVLLSIGALRDKNDLLQTLKDAQPALEFLATPGTADFLRAHGVPTTTVSWSVAQGVSTRNTLVTLGVSVLLNVSMLDRVLNRGPDDTDGTASRGHRMRRFAIDHDIPLLTDVKASKLFLRALVTPSPPDDGLMADSDSSRRRIVLPGLIDPHVHVREPGPVYKGGWATESRAALAGGFDTVLVMPNTDPPITDDASLGLIRRLAKESSVVQYGFFLGGATDNHDAIVAIMSRQDPDVVGMKLYLDTTFSGSLHMGDSWGAVAKHFHNWAQHGWRQPIVVHTEYDNMLRVLGLMAVYPDVRVHIAHVHEPALMDLKIAACDRGFKLTCEVTPHHLLLDAGHIETCGHHVKPPLQAANPHLEAYLPHIECIATDHAPHTADETGCPGYPGLETSLALMARFGEKTVREKMYDGPRRIFGLPPSKATVVVELVEDGCVTVPAAPLYSKTRWTPFAGMPVSARVLQVWGPDGKLVFRASARPDGVLRSLGGPVSSRHDAVSFPSSPPHSPHSPRSYCSHEYGDEVWEGDETWEGREEEKGGDVPQSGLSSTLPPWSHTSLLTVDGLTRGDLRQLFALADSQAPRSDALKGRVIGTVFLEPSSRTHGSFASAVMQLGGSVLALDAGSSSLAKGESVADTVATWATYTDALVIRGNAGQFDLHTLRDALPPDFPVINAGYDVESHPTQALLDLYTIRQERGSLTGCTVGVYGDLKHGRTVRSLLRLLQLYDVTVVAIGAPEWQLPPDAKASLTGLTVRRVDVLRDVMPSLDVLYMTRTQTERLGTSSAVCPPPAPLTPALLALAKPSLILMHPLPRGPEFPDAVADDPRAVHVKQMANGLAIRKALMCMLMRV